MRVAGAIPDLGAHRAAEILSARLGVIVTSDGVVELSRRGMLQHAGWYKDWPLYDGQGDRGVRGPRDSGGSQPGREPAHRRRRREVPAHPARRLRSPDPSRAAGASGLGPRPVGPARPIQRAAVSQGDLDDLSAHTDIDWHAVRSTPAGRRSQLAAPPTAPKGSRAMTTPQPDRPRAQ